MLRINYSKRARDYVIHYPSKDVGWVAHDLIRSDSFKEFESDLLERGFDLSTLKISVKKKVEK